MFPEAKLTGVDISPMAVEKGNGWLQEAGLHNVHLEYGRAEDLYRFKANSFDIVFSWATLIYPQPSSIKGILMNMLRVAMHVLVLIEMQSEETLRGKEALGVFRKGEWKRDYVEILRSLDSSIDVYQSWVPKDQWSPGGGGGALIVAIKK
jgi:ubiquinone/menaquinone biosynthesis C-methylase UbiE